MREVLGVLSSMLAPVFSLGPLNLSSHQAHEDDLKQLGSNLWKEDPNCLQWLQSKEPNSVLTEFAWGSLQASCCPQVQVLSDPSVGRFLNSTIESISFGVPMICWKLTAMSREIKLLDELTEREKGKATKKMAEEATSFPNDSPYKSLSQIINQVLISPLG
ncbi:7-deoxyloganetin glucosyltransferase-like [Hibiscus syriacus]|uniref:7-deoxyloganetin glucosyltransferase-like n=1 Tax=Hibiscus syriacus TaxID=106335 RepID=UPI001923FE7A|nr:7-deoxyloganetin glucosyltransferase-like [Hibiscus syriacus]